MTPEPPADAELVRALEEGLRSRGEPGAVERLERAPYAYATSFPLEEIHAHLVGGRVLQLILKDLTWERLLGDAARSKPRFLYQPRRSVETYRRTLAASELGGGCYGAHADDASGRYWLLLEKFPGLELWQIGTFATWESVARWLARFHLAFAGDPDGLLEQNPYLIRYGEDFLSMWPRRALAAADGDAGARRALERIASRYDEVTETLGAVPPTLVHGELYPSNLLVAETPQGPAKVWPVDWEMAGVGPAFLDVAALSAGWTGPEQERLVSAYLDELGPASWRREGPGLARVLDCSRLHYALQWLGWSDGWSPPPEHARDWAGEAIAAAERLGL